MSKPRLTTQIISSDFDQFANDLAMAVWNHLAHLPQFGHLYPKDFPLLYETIHRELERLEFRSPVNGSR